MAEFVLKYADARGQIHQQVATAASEKELRDRYSQQGFLIYSIKPRPAASADRRFFGGQQEDQPGEVPDLQPAVRHADPRRAADSESARPAGRPADRSQTGAVHQERSATRCGTARCCRTPSAQQGIFPKIYVTSVMAGEKSGSLTRSAGPLHHLPEAVAGGAQEDDGFADVSLRADRAGGAA